MCKLKIYFMECVLMSVRELSLFHQVIIQTHQHIYSSFSKTSKALPLTNTTPPDTSDRPKVPFVNSQLAKNQPKKKKILKYYHYDTKFDG